MWHFGQIVPVVQVINVITKLADVFEIPLGSFVRVRESYLMSMNVSFSVAFTERAKQNMLRLCCLQPLRLPFSPPDLYSDRIFTEITINISSLSRLSLMPFIYVQLLKINLKVLLICIRYKQGLSQQICKGSDQARCWTSLISWQVLPLAWRSGERVELVIEFDFHSSLAVATYY